MKLNITTWEFETAFETLNREQKEAVLRTEGPVLVLAGPGTGKTKVLAVRIGQILHQNDAGAGAILCLTYTTAGVQSMKEKLFALLGPEADKVEVDTFHSFANKVIAKGSGTAITSSQTVLSTAQSYMILEKLLSQPAVAGSHVTEKPKTVTYLKSLADLFTDFKKEDIDKEFLSSLVAIEKERCLSNPDFYGKRGDLLKDGRELLDKLSKFEELGTLYEAYNEELKRRAKFEFEDLLNKAICMLYEDAELLASLQETYQYILVDEFQDTNAKQLKLIELMISGVEDPNLFIVGDDDQCIYKFQGAGNENLTAITALLPRMHRIRLEKNYRSDQQILDLSHQLIRNNPERPVEKQAALTAANGAGKVRITPPHAFVSTKDEAYATACNIQTLLQQGVPPHEIAVLFRKRSYAYPLINWLRYYQIPFNWQGSKGNVLGEKRGKTYLAALRYFELKEAGVDDLQSFLIQWCMQQEGSEKMAILYTKYRHERMEKELFAKWVERTKPDEAVYALVMKTCPVHMNEPITDEGLQAIEALTGLDAERNDPAQAAMIAAWDSFVNELRAAHTESTWAVLSRMLHYHQHHSIPISYDQISDAASVRLSTIHGSKGLEYAYVFVMGCSNHQWEEAKHEISKVTIPKPMYEHLNKPGDNPEDLRRLLYVALTRAKKSLTLSYVADGKKYRPSSLIKELLPYWTQEPIVHEATDFSFTTSAVTHVPLSPALQEAWHSAMKLFELTASSFNDYLNQPEKFIWHSFFKLPDLPAAAMSFGTCIHSTLEDLFNNRHAQPIQDTLIEERWYHFIDSKRYLFDPLHYRQYRNFGKDLLLRYFKTDKRVQPGIVYTSESYLHGQYGAVKLSGKIDLLEQGVDTIRIIDYKTGLSGKKNLAPFISADEPGDSYWRQAAFYILLVRQEYPDKICNEAVFHMLEKDKKQYPVVNLELMSEAWTAFLEDVWTKINSAALPAYTEQTFYKN
jgi:DNA helicase-2/ATP-dependent DNA helicase PcrA